MAKRGEKGPRTLPVSHEDIVPPQDILDLFKVSFSDELYGDELNLHSQIQSVKADLYERKYVEAFNSDEKRVAYCCRWSPSRAIAYTSLFAQLNEVKRIIECKRSEENVDEDDDEEDSLEKSVSKLNIETNSTNVLCIGGGAGGELVAIASIFAPSRDYNSKFASSQSKSKTIKAELNLQLVDISDWSNIVERLESSIKSKWLRSEADCLNVTFKKADILSLSPKELNLKNLDLITLLFTTNELFMENKSQSIRFLQSLNAHCTSNTYLLIVESAGSFSHIEVGSKKFPIQFLIDTILQGKRGEESRGSWEVVSMEDTIWYRCAETFDYKLKLENMRFFYRLYRKK